VPLATTLALHAPDEHQAWPCWMRHLSEPVGRQLTNMHSGGKMSSTEALWRGAGEGGMCGCWRIAVQNNVCSAMQTHEHR